MPARILPSVLLCFLCLLPAWSVAAAPNEDASPSWTIQVDPLTVALGFVHVQVEWAFSTHASIYVGPSLKLFKSPTEEPEQKDYLGLGAEVGGRGFFLQGAPSGWWAQVRGVIAHLSADLDGGGTATDVGGYVSALVGYTWIYDDWFVLSGGLGVQYLHYVVVGRGIEGVVPAAHTTIGVAF